jgi:hypothetical protein
MKHLIKHLRPPSTLSGKLVLLSTTSLIFATVLVFLLVTFQQQRLLRTEWAESLSAQANLIASNSRAAIAFGDPFEANRLLATVATNPFVSGRRRRACALASVRRSNCTCGFPACSFHEGA